MRISLKNLENELKLKNYHNKTFEVIDHEIMDALAKAVLLLDQYEVKQYDINLKTRAGQKNLHITFEDKIYSSDLNGFTVQEKEMEYRIGKKKIPFGIDDFAKLRKMNGYYVDKTRFIKKFCESISEVTLITRPRRFGKTINMSMMAEFFDITKDSKDLFHDTEIVETRYVKEMNQYPVIFLSFKDCKGGKDDVLDEIYQVILKEYERYVDQFKKIKSNIIKDKIVNLYQTLKEAELSDKSNRLISRSILSFMEYLHDRYQKPVLLLIDEYDTPFMASYNGGYYEEIKGFLSGLLSRSLKGNPYLYRAVLTGCQRIAKENIFSGLNNLKVCGIHQDAYSDCFGFTEDETRQMLEYYGVPFDQMVKQMYDGYHIGNHEIYNPWSILNYAEERKLNYYWVDTGDNRMIKELAMKKESDFIKVYDQLILEHHAMVSTSLSENYAYGDSSGIWSLLINAGYLTIEKEIRRNLYQVRIVNEEVMADLSGIANICLGIDMKYIDDMLEALKKKDMETFIKNYQTILITFPSYYDLKDENSYHMILMTNCSLLSRDYEIISNRESGHGRVDLMLKSRHNETDIIFELKSTKDSKTNLKELAEKALEQIKEKQYAQRKGTLMIGIAHYMKTCEIKYEN